MKQAFVKWVSLLLAVLILLTFAACANNTGGKENESKETQTQGQSGAPTEESTEEPTEEPTEETTEDVTEAPTQCAHRYDKGKVTVFAKTFDAGEKLYTCMSCHETYTEEIPATGSLKVLAVGNSFSVNTLHYMGMLAEEAGIKDFVIATLYISGCTLAKHNQNIEGEAKAYEYYKCTKGINWKITPNVSVQEALADEDWDVITLQQSSGNSGDPDTFGKLSDVAKFLDQNKPKETTLLLWHQTWAYQQDSTNSSFPKYDSDQMKMYSAIMDTVQKVVLKEKKFDGVIPVGTAIQNARTSYIGDTLCRDGYHLNKSYGYLLGALTWHAYIAGGDWDKLEFMPWAKEYLPAIREAIQNSLEKPYEVTQATAQKP